MRRGVRTTILAGLATLTLGSTVHANGNGLTTFALVPQILTGSPLPVDSATYLTPSTSPLSESALIRKVLGIDDPVTLTRERHFNSSRASDHRRYRVLWDGIPVVGAYLDVHLNGNRIVLMNARLPRDLAWDPTSLYGLTDFNDLMFRVGVRRDLVREVEKVLFVADGELRPGWCFKVLNPGSAPAAMVVDAIDGTLISSERLQFDVATALVYAKNSAEASPVEQSLIGLFGSGWLDGTNFAVFGPDKDTDRAFSETSEYRFSPDSQATLFDQAQTYFTAGRALDWFRSKFGYDPGGMVVNIYTESEIGNNARYLPAIGEVSAQIQLGRGANGVLINLSRDSDVIIHEFSHHVLFAHLKTTRGETGLLHEGFADYFAYALNGDGNLGETIVPGEPYLRTANLPAEPRFDDPAQPQTPHNRGSHWASLLWKLRTEIGDDFDHVVYDSLGYLSPDAGTGEAFIGLLQADRDRFPLAADSPDRLTFGQHKCRIMELGVARGFTAALASLDGTSCSLDLGALHEARLKEIVPPKKETHELRVLGQTCGVAGGHADGSAWLIYFLPLLATLRRRRA